MSVSLLDGLMPFTMYSKKLAINCENPDWYIITSQLIKQGFKAIYILQRIYSMSKTIWRKTEIKATEGYFLIYFYNSFSLYM